MRKNLQWLKLNTESQSVLEEHTAEANQNKPVSDDKAKEEKISSTELSQVTKEKEKEDRLLQERKQNFNKDWYFKLNAQGDFSKKDVDVHDWSKLNLPHDWSIYFDLITNLLLEMRWSIKWWDCLVS